MMNKGGKREGAGAPKKPAHLLAKHRSIRMNDEIFQWFKELGGTKYLVMMVRRDKYKL